jgi:hypothetical protein
MVTSKVKNGESRMESNTSKAKGDRKRTNTTYTVYSMVISRPTMESRNEPRQRGAVGDASRMGLGLRGAMRMCETADEPSDQRTSYLGKCDDPLSTKV